MTQSMKSQMKKLTRIRLINWHYFTDETIDVRGSILFSGENASGKSTILDAIQLVLTTNSNRFNPAANEKSKRKLIGYVRCKTGEEGNAYIRNTGAVISYVALEFYEESKDNYFVIGVKLDSPDLESDINKKWFCVEGDLSSLTFIVDGKPALDREFTQNGKKIQFITQVSSAKETFKVRLGRLDDNFGDMIIKAMAFRPMDKVKDFINNFILPKNVIQTENLQENIRNLREMQKLINEVKAQIERLHAIIEKADDIESKAYDILVIDILIKIANLEDKRIALSEMEKSKASDEAILKTLKNELNSLNDVFILREKRKTELDIALSSNEVGRLIEKIEENIRKLKVDLAREKLDAEEYKTQVNRISDAVRCINHNNLVITTLRSDKSTTEEKAAELENIRTFFTNKRDVLYQENSRIETDSNNLKATIIELEERINKLKKNQFEYNKNTTMLLESINEEFVNRRINSEARVFADLLEISMPEWQDAVEGYLNTQRFNIIVEPQYFDIASEVYERIRGKIHSVGLVDVQKMMKDEDKDYSDTLAVAVTSDNRFARAYANYVLGRVMRCEKVTDLRKHKIAVTKSCMKYQGYVLSKIDSEIYKTPFIGKRALQIQLKNAEDQLRKAMQDKEDLENKRKSNKTILDAINNCNFDVVKSLLSISNRLRETERNIQKEGQALAEARNNPTFLDLSMQQKAATEALEEVRDEVRKKEKEITNKERDIVDKDSRVSILKNEVEILHKERDSLGKQNTKASEEANARYFEMAKTRSPKTIADNYGPRRQTVINQQQASADKMIELQAKYKDGDFGTGMANIQLYRDDLTKLEKSDLISYEDKLATVQADCELEFRENFLAKMRENIENAEITFSKLNKSLKGIYYGNDSYKFELSANKEKQSLYDMITSDVNVAGQTLFSSSFEEKYHEEMDYLFSQLTDENLADSSVVNELTDYRTYLDYDIQVISKEGKMQRFSKTYGEKSGGETQTPYYVAIAASFAQMYSGRETARIVMLDEAFNNMDEDRIESMMFFLKSQDFQLILAAPPARMEVIGEHVDSIYLTIHKGNTSTVEEYFL